MGARATIDALEFSDDNRSLLTATADGTLRLWEIASGREISVLHEAPRVSNFTGITFASSLGCFFAVDCGGHVSRWGLLPENVPGTESQQLAAARTQSIPELSEQLVLRAIDQPRCTFDRQQLGLDQTDPAESSVAYRFVTNAVLRMAQLRTVGKLPESWKSSAAVKEAIERELGFPVSDEIGLERKALAILALSNLVPERSLDYLVDSHVEDSVAEQVILFLASGHLSVPQIVETLAQAEDAVAQTRLLTLLKEAKVLPAEAASSLLKATLLKLIRSDNNRVRACVNRLVKSKRQNLSSINLRNEITHFGPAFNSAGQPLAYLEATDSGAAPFAISMYPVTERQFAAVRFNQTVKSDLPQTNVSLLDAARFCNDLSLREGLEPCYRIGPQDVAQYGIELANDVKEMCLNYEIESEDLPVLLPNSSGYRLPSFSEWELLQDDFPAGSETPPAGSDTSIASLLKTEPQWSALPNTEQLDRFSRPVRHGLKFYEIVAATIPKYVPALALKRGVRAPSVIGDAPAPPAEDAPAPPGKKKTSTTRNTGIPQSVNSERNGKNTNQKSAELMVPMHGNPTTSGFAVVGHLDRSSKSEDLIRFRHPDPRVGFRVVRRVSDGFTRPPERPYSFVVLDSIGQAHIKTVSRPKIVETAFGQRVFAHVIRILTVEEDVPITYTVTKHRTEERERTRVDDSGAEVTETFTVEVPYSEQVIGTKKVQRYVEEEHLSVFDIQKCCRGDRCG